MNTGQCVTRVTATALTAHRFLHGLFREQIAELLPAARRVTSRAPALRRWRHRRGFWLIRSGSVALDLHVPGAGQLIVETLGMGDALGWSWLVAPYISTLGAVTVQPTEAFHFDGPAVRALCDADPQLGYELTRRFLAVAANRLQASRARLLDRYVPARPWP